MQVYYCASIPPRTTIYIDTVDTLGMTCGAKKIAVCSNSSDVCFAWSEFPIVLSDLAGISHFEFPIVNGKSPSNFQVTNLGDEEAVINFLVEEMGGLADPLYFQ